MSSTQLFFNFVADTSREVKSHFSKYLGMFLSLVVLANLEEVYKAFGGQEGDGGSIAIGLVSIVLTIIIGAKIILMHKKNATSDDKLVYILFPFLLYSFYYSFFFFIGLIFLIIPGIWVLIYLSQAPFIAALSPTKENFFKMSIRLVKKNATLVAWASISSVLLEFFSLAYAPIEDQKIRFFLTFLFSIPDAFFTIVLTIVSVKIFYYLTE